MAHISTVRLPYYFYDITSTLPDGTRRWVDEFAPVSDVLVTPKETSRSYIHARNKRNAAYEEWLRLFTFKDQYGNPQPLFKQGQWKWQAIQVMTIKHSESNRKDWWDHYQDALFRVFLNPQTIYDRETGEHKQWYLLSPEDCYLVNKHELEKNGPTLPPRDKLGEEMHISKDKRLRQARLIPVECCRHWRHETTAGKLPEGL